MEEEDDPLAFIAKLCYISPSQQSPARRSRISTPDPAPASDEDDDFLDPAYLPPESAPVFLASPPDSAEEENTQSDDLFHTPPDRSPAADQSEDNRTVEVGSLVDNDTVPVDFGYEESFPSVNSKMDIDLGPLQEDLKSVQRIEQNTAFQSQSDGSRVSRSGSSPAEPPIEESPSKRLKITGTESPDLHLGIVQEKPREEIPNFFEKLNSMNVSSSAGDASASTMELVVSPIPRSNGEIDEDIGTGREALMENFEKLNSMNISSSPGGVSDPTMELVVSPIPRSNDEIDEDNHTGREALMEKFEKLDSMDISSSPSNVSAPTMELVTPPNPRSNDEIDGDIGTDREALMEDFEELKTGIVSEDIVGAEMEKEAEEKRDFSPLINATPEAAASKLDVMNEAAAFYTTTSVKIPLNPRSNDEINEDIHTRREALMKNFEELKTEIVSEDTFGAEMEKEAEEKREFSPLIDATPQAAASKPDVMNEAAAFDTTTSVKIPPNPRSSDETNVDIHTGREALMKNFEELKTEIVSEDMSSWNRCEMEKEAEEKREFSPLIDATPEAAASKPDVMNEAAAFDTTTSVKIPPNPRSNDEIDEDMHTGTEALMENFEELKTEIVSEDIESNWNRCEKEKIDKENRAFSPLINATAGAAASKLDVMKESAAFATTTSVNVTQGTTRNAMGSAAPNENKNNPTEISLADVLRALGKDDPDEENLRHLSIMDVARRRCIIVTPSWWPEEGF